MNSEDDQALAPGSPLLGPPAVVAGEPERR